MADNSPTTSPKPRHENHPVFKPVPLFWPGNNRFWWGGKLVSGPWEDLSAQCLVALFVLGVSYLYYTRVIITFPASYRLIGEIVFGGLLGLVVAAYFKVHLTDPGIIPRKYFFHVPGLINRSQLEIDVLLNGEHTTDPPEPKQDEESKDKQNSSESFPNQENLPESKTEQLGDASTQTSPTLSSLRGPRLRRQRSRGYDKTGCGRIFCPICRIYSPMKAAHCAVCDNCVEVHAYHITFMGNCIGKRNFKHFVSFLGVTVAFLANFLVQYAIHYNHKRREERDKGQHTDNEQTGPVPYADSPLSVVTDGLGGFSDLKEGFRLISLLVFGLFGVLIVIGALIYLAVLLYFVVK